MIENLCEFFKAVEADPSKKVYGLTIRDMLNLKNHVQECDDCYLRTQRVLSKSPKYSGIDISLN